jgi:hypothetical protein
MDRGGGEARARVRLSENRSRFGKYLMDAPHFESSARRLTTRRFLFSFSVLRFPSTPSLPLNRASQVWKRNGLESRTLAELQTSSWIFIRRFLRQTMARDDASEEELEPHAAPPSASSQSYVSVVSIWNPRSTSLVNSIETAWEVDTRRRWNQIAGLGINAKKEGKISPTSIRLVIESWQPHEMNIYNHQRREAPVQSAVTNPKLDHKQRIYGKMSDRSRSLSIETHRAIWFMWDCSGAFGVRLVKGLVWPQPRVVRANR